MSRSFVIKSRYEKNLNCFQCSSKCLQYHRGREPNTEIWVFGMVDITHKPALGYIEIVARRDAVTLLPIIGNHLHPGTEVWSDEWRSYSNVGNLTNVSVHRTVNHCQLC